jgi:hypothetical protein
MEFKMKYFILIISFANCFAAVPTVEGLFRNSQNPDIEDNLAVLTIRAQVENKIANSEGQKEESETTEVTPDYSFYKYLFDNSDMKLNKVLISKYENREMPMAELIGMVYEKDVTTVEEGKEQSFEKRFITALMTMYGMNSSTIMSQMFKKYSDNYLTNEEVLNSDKKELLNQYKEYLVKKNEYDKKIKDLKESGGLDQGDEVKPDDEPKSPLVSEEDEEKDRIQKIISESMYKKGEHVKLVREGRDYFWELSFNNLWARFTNENHELKQLKMTVEGKEIEVIPHEVVTYAGKYRVPKTLEINFPDKKVTIEITNFYTLKSKNKTFDQRIEDYKKYYNKYLERTKKEEKVKKDEEAQVVEMIVPRPEIADFLF